MSYLNYDLHFQILLQTSLFYVCQLYMDMFFFYSCDFFKI